MTALLLFLCGSAFAQGDFFDAHGAHVAASDMDLRDPIIAWRPESQRTGSLALAALLEYIDEPMVLHTLDQDEHVTQVMLDDVVGVNMGLNWGVSKRLAITANMPVYLHSVGVDARGVGVGDLRVAVPIGLVLPDEYSGGFGAGLVAFADMPTGNQDQFLGERWLSGGGLATLGYGGHAWEIDVNAGMRFAPQITYPASNEDEGQWNNVLGGGRFVGAIAAGVNLNESHALRFEANMQNPLSGSPVQYSQNPAELLLSGRGRYDNGLAWTLGAARGVNGAVGSAKFRVFAGAGYVFGKPPAKPDIASLRVLVVEKGTLTPITDAVVSVDLEEGEVDEQGWTLFKKMQPGETVRAAADASGYIAGSEMVDLVLGENETRIVLAPKPGRIVVTVRNTEGDLLNARVGVHNDDRRFKPAQIGDDGTGTFRVPAGEWQVFATADGYSAKRAVATVPRGGIDELEFILDAPVVEVTQDEVVVLEKVHFVFDKAEIVPESLPLLRRVADVLVAHPELTLIEIQGHTDSRGSDEYNLDLSQRRVETVMRYLVDQGVPADHLAARGFGESELVSTDDTEEAHAMNRRVQFLILERGELEGVEIQTPEPDDDDLFDDDEDLDNE